MKRSVSFVLLLLLMMAFFPGTACAEEQVSLPYYVSDVAGLLSVDQWQSLETEAEKISEKYQCGVYLVVLDDYRSYRSGNEDYWTFSQNFYKSYDLGLGEDRNGILLIMSMAERDYSILAYGSNAHYAFTDYGKQDLENNFLDNFRREDWYGGLRDYINGCGDLLARADAGQPLDVEYADRTGTNNTVGMLVTVCVPLLVAFSACEVMKRNMKPVNRRTTAEEYIVPGGVDLSVKKDIFVNRTVTRTVIRTENRDSGGDGGGGTTVNSGGFSGHSGKF